MATHSSVPAWRIPGTGEPVYGVAQNRRRLKQLSSSTSSRAFLLAQTLKNLPAMWETQVRSLGGEDPWRRKWLPTPILLPGESHGQRSLVGCGPRGHRESDMTERLSFIQSYSVCFSLAYFTLC